MYSRKIIEVFDQKNIEMGDRVIAKRNEKTYEGRVMPRSGESDVLVIKLDNGYNVGFLIDTIELEKSFSEEPIQNAPELIPSDHDPSKPIISILSTGGTIASKIDYRTGGVKPTFTAEEIITMIPEIAKIANIKGRLIQNISSEDMLFSDYEILAEEIAEEIKSGARGVIITHGTDTLHYTAAALSFAFEGTPVPIILVGSQRSSDRGSSDGPFNIMSAANFIVNSDYAGVAVCMHSSPSDVSCEIIEGTRARKMHTSRRDAFASINAFPIAHVGPDFIEFDRDYPKAEDLNIMPNFEKKVGLIKTHTGMDPEAFSSCVKGMKGVVIEGTGLGHVPESILKPLKDYITSGGTAVMSSQCISGRVNMNVYSRGRDLLEMGVIPAEDMTPETAFIKLSWVLSNYPDQVKEKMTQNLRGEISERSVA